MTAPSDDYVLNWQVQAGTMLVPMPTAAVGTFVDTTSISVLAAFPQNYLTNVRSGDEVELVWMGIRVACLKEAWIQLYAHPEAVS